MSTFPSLDSSGSPFYDFGIDFGAILGAIFHHFSILFRTPQNLVFAIPYSVFEGFSNLKALILGPLFDHFFDPILEPPLEEPFGQHWSLKVPTFPPHVDFWIPNRPLERPGAARKVKM